MTLLTIGIDHHQTTLALRERLYLSAAQTGLLLDRLRTLPGVAESAALSTCNRLEVYAAIDGDETHIAAGIVRALGDFCGIEPEALEAAVQVRQDGEAATHLLRVAAGLESMIVGEPQILGQVRHALDIAQQINSTGPLLNRLFMTAIHTGKRARSETAINRHTTSLGQAAARLAADADRVLVIGAGEMGALALRALATQGVPDVRLINRGEERARQLGRQYPGVTVHDWSGRREQIAAADAVIVATGAHQPVIHVFDIAGRAVPLLLIDIAVPRNVDAAVCDLPNVVYRDLDSIRQVVDEGQAQRLACVPDVEGIVAEEAAGFDAWLATRQVIPTINDLRHKIEQLVQAELADALGKLSHLEARDRDVLTRMASGIINTMLHDPTTGLKRQAAGGQPDYAGVVRELFALDSAAG